MNAAVLETAGRKRVGINSKFELNQWVAACETEDHSDVEVKDQFQSIRIDLQGELTMF